MQNYLATFIETHKDVKHYGVRGMKWGVRKRRDGGGSSAPSEPQTVKIRQNPKNGRLETAGGGGHKPSVDAVTAAAIRQKAKASGLSSLDNKELQALINRMNLEANYAKAMAANAPPKNFLQKVIAGELDSAMKGKKGPFTNMVGAIITGGGKAYTQQKAKKAATKGATKVATKVLVGRVVN